MLPHLTDLPVNKMLVQIMAEVVVASTTFEARAGNPCKECGQTTGAGGDGHAESCTTRATIDALDWAQHYLGIAHNNVTGEGEKKST